MKSVHYQEHGVANVWYMGMQFGILWQILWQTPQLKPNVRKPQWTAREATSGKALSF